MAKTFRLWKKRVGIIVTIVVGAIGIAVTLVGIVVTLVVQTDSEEEPFPRDQSHFTVPFWRVRLVRFLHHVPR